MKSQKKENPEIIVKRMRREYRKGNEKLFKEYPELKKKSGIYEAISWLFRRGDKLNSIWLEKLAEELRYWKDKSESRNEDEAKRGKEVLKVLKDKLEEREWYDQVSQFKLKKQVVK